MAKPPTMPGQLPPVPESSMVVYPLGEEPPPRTSARWPDGAIMVGDAQDGRRADPIRPYMRHSAALPPTDPLRALKGDIGDETVVRASQQAAPAQSKPFRPTSPAQPGPTSAKPFRTK